MPRSFFRIVLYPFASHPQTSPFSFTTLYPCLHSTAKVQVQCGVFALCIPSNYIQRCSVILKLTLSKLLDVPFNYFQGESPLACLRGTMRNIYAPRVVSCTRQTKVAYFSYHQSCFGVC